MPTADEAVIARRRYGASGAACARLPAGLFDPGLSPD
jgi:hypothetical protein